MVEVEGLMMERDWRDQCHELLKQARSKSDVLKVTTKRETTWEGGGWGNMKGSEKEQCGNRERTKGCWTKEVEREDNHLVLGNQSV